MRSTRSFYEVETLLNSLPPENTAHVQSPYLQRMIHVYRERRMWDIHVEGAVSYSITFDPLTKTEPQHDYVRFLKVRIVLFLYSCISPVQTFQGGVASTAVATC